MKKWIQRREKGQVMVILVVGVTALLAFAALAIDGGMYFSDRRYDQNAADDSAFAGAGEAAEVLLTNEVNYSNFTCDTTATDAAEAAAIVEAISRASANNFSIIGDLSTEHGVTTNCVIDTSGTYDKKYIEVHVMVTSFVETAFAHMFFGTNLRSTVEAITIVEPSEGVGKGLAIVALDDECHGNLGGLEFDGNSSVTIQFSGAHSNACMIKNGGVDVNATGGAMHYMSTWTDNGSSGAVTPAPTSTTEEIIRLDVDPPACGPKPNPKPPKVQNGGNLTPGWYESIRVNNGQTLTLDPGLYCIEDNFIANGGSVIVDSIDPNKDDGVTIYIVGGDFSIAGSVHIELRAPRKKADGTMGAGVPDAIPGMLIYLADGNTGNIVMRGDSSSSYRGTVYAPDGSIEVGGTSSSINSFGTQFVANDVKIHGTADLQIDFDGDDIYWGYPFLGLDK